MMTRCYDLELEFAAYRSGELDPAERKLVENHLSGCAACRAEFTREKNLHTVLGTLPRVGAPPEFETLLAGRIRTVSAAPAGPARAGRLTAAALLVAACLTVAILVPNLRQDSAPDWTEQEIAAARQEVMFTLALTARVIDRTQKEAVLDVFVDKLPQAIDASFKTMKPTNPGGKG